MKTEIQTLEARKQTRFYELKIARRHGETEREEGLLVAIDAIQTRIAALYDRVLASS